MDYVYIVRWGPALGDDYSAQVFTEKSTMLTFVDKLKGAQLELQRIRDEEVEKPILDDHEILNYEVHHVVLNAVPENILDVDLGMGCSDLICFGEYPNVQIWRTNTEMHQS
jgi:hypothetical protein